jgi:hypothetical protein
MSVDRFLLRLEECVVDLFQGLCDPATRLQWQAERVEQELGRRRALLRRHGETLDELRRQIHARRERESVLKSWVETYLRVADRANAWRYALELDQLREGLAEDRSRLKRYEAAYRENLADVEHLEHRLTRLHGRRAACQSQHSI